MPRTPKIDSTRVMCRSKKSIKGHVDLCSSSRMSVSAVVEKASGVTGPAAALSRISTTRRASAIVEMNGISRRSKRRSGNWISSAFPIVSALIPVLSDRKKTGTAGCSSGSGGGIALGYASGLTGITPRAARPVVRVVTWADLRCETRNRSPNVTRLTPSACDTPVTADTSRRCGRSVTGWPVADDGARGAERGRRTRADRMPSSCTCTAGRASGTAALVCSCSASVPRSRPTACWTAGSSRPC